MKKNDWTGERLGRSTGFLSATDGWKPNSGKDGYNVHEIGMVHPQSQAIRAFGVFA